MVSKATSAPSVRLKSILEEVARENDISLKDARTISEHVLERIIAELSEGNRVKLGELGIFRPGATRDNSLVFKYVKKPPVK